MTKLTTATTILLALGTISLWTTVTQSQPAPGDSAVVMREAARTFLTSLTADQRARCVSPYEEETVEQWHFIPMEDRSGLSYKEMAPHQLHLAQALVAGGLSHAGFLKVNTIMSLEQVLHELEAARGGRMARLRDPQLYYLAIYGEPGADAWGWRIEGHHVSLHFTLAGNRVLSTTPAFLGANPHRVADGPLAGVRALGAEEDLARGLLESLDERQRAATILADEAPRDIFTSNARAVAFTDVPAEGLPVGEMTPDQRAGLQRLIDVYIDNVDGAEADARRRRVREAGDQIRFAWMGSTSRGEPHYYRIHAATFLIEYDNVQSSANHSHTVWRDYDNDFGRDWLAEHHRSRH